MKILVVGGGTAGWLSALFCQRFFPNFNITLIEDSKTGIIGVGESTTPSIIDLINFLGISVDDLILNCGATIKNSVKFTNWNNDGKSYCNGFNTIPELDIFSTSYKNCFTSSETIWPAHKPFAALKEISSGQNLDEIHFSAIMSNNNQIPIDKISDDQYASFALHFDAKKFAAYLKKIGVEREITLIDGKVVESELYDTGYVKSVTLDNKQKIDCDFIFDCSGFARIFVDKTYNSKFNSFQDYLPVKKALPFFIENKKFTPSFTEAISMKYGWLWKTPVENRFGCGYVFDSDYINEDEAYNEVCTFLGKEVDVPRVIQFESGYYQSVWNKNTLAVGLSSGFLEPLEATSIWITVISLYLLTEHAAGIIHKDQKAIDEYNSEFNKKIESILALVRLHYCTQRSDTPFWKDFLHKNKTPTLLEELLEMYSYRLPSLIEGPKYNAFPTHSWYNVIAGNKIFSNDIVEKECITYNINNFSNSEFKSRLNNFAKNCFKHDDYLNLIRNKT